MCFGSGRASGGEPAFCPPSVLGPRWLSWRPWPSWRRGPSRECWPVRDGQRPLWLLGWGVAGRLEGGEGQQRAGWAPSDPASPLQGQDGAKGDRGEDGEPGQPVSDQRPSPKPKPSNHCSSVPTPEGPVAGS